MKSLEDIMQRHLSATREARQANNLLVSRVVTAIRKGDFDGLSNVVRDATGITDSESGTSGAESVEAGVTHGTAGNQGSAESPA